MDAAPDLDFASSIRYALTSRPVPGGVEIVLDLFRGAAPALTRTVASVSPHQAATVMARCSRYLERSGAHAVGGTDMTVVPDPVRGVPGAASNWMFAG